MGDLINFIAWPVVLEERFQCQIWCMGVLNQAASLPISLSLIPSMNFTSATTPAK